MLNIAFFAIYLVIVLVLFSVIILVFVRIRESNILRSESLTRFTQIFVGILFLIAIFGGYKLLTGKIFPVRSGTSDIIIHL